MEKKIIVKITFYAFFTGFIIWSVYVNTLELNPQAVIMLGVLIVLTRAYFDNKTLLKRLELKYESQEELINTFSSNCPDLIAYKDNNLKYITCNKAMCNLFRLKSADKIKNTNVLELLPLKAASVIMEHDKKVLQSGESQKYVVELDHPVLGPKIYDVISAPTIHKHEVIGVITVARDITIRERLRTKFMEKQRQINGMLENLPMMAFLTDNEGRYIRGNNKFLKLLNVKHNEIIGINVAREYTRTNMETIAYETEVVLKEKTTLVTENLYNISNNPPTWYKEYRVPIFDDKNNVIGITVFLLDIQNEKEANQQKERFIATLSHDLKTPTIAQIRSLEMLIKGMFGEMNEEQTEMLKMTLESCKNMYDMVSTVLHSYKFENNEIKLNYTDISLTEIAAECCNDLAKHASEKNIEIQIKPKTKKDIIRADRSFIKRAISNILENSISYAFERTNIEIIIKEKDNIASLLIKTNSPFIKKEAIKTMFDKYLGQTSYNKIGFCLKLHLSKQIIEAHSGHIIAESKETNHNTFGFSIPSRIELKNLQEIML